MRSSDLVCATIRLSPTGRAIGGDGVPEATTDPPEGNPSPNTKINGLPLLAVGVTVKLSMLFERVRKYKPWKVEEKGGFKTPADVVNCESSESEAGELGLNSVLSLRQPKAARPINRVMNTIDLLMVFPQEELSRAAFTAYNKSIRSSGFFRTRSAPNEAARVNAFS